MKITGILTLAVGITFIMLEHVFYGDVDTNGVLQESLFLPLGALFTIIGLVLLTVYGGKRVFHALRSS